MVIVLTRFSCVFCVAASLPAEICDSVVVKKLNHSASVAFVRLWDSAADLVCLETGKSAILSWLENGTFLRHRPPLSDAILTAGLTNAPVPRTSVGQVTQVLGLVPNIRHGSCHTKVML